ncbi:hypothetical protein [Arthrobacter sp. B0490]|uniref:hypothetical protein n=1 Tax=Arthrobacter sp. B0490 TaxID=2058891 RepID=UPI0015E3B3CC|nr:hypothetical protein [Arthrobacter sp. B0490]
MNLILTLQEQVNGDANEGVVGDALTHRGAVWLASFTIEATCEHREGVGLFNVNAGFTPL